jgi:hypothetical protein
LLLENPSPSLKSSKIACSFNSLCLLLSFIHSFNKETHKLFHSVKIVFAKHNSCIQLSKENQTGFHTMHASCVWSTAVVFFGLASFLGLKNGRSIKMEWMILKKDEFFYYFHKIFIHTRNDTHEM